MTSPNRPGQGGNNTWDNGNLSYDALFGSHYDSAKDEDYSENEDLLLNMQTYKKDWNKTYSKLRVSKAEAEFLRTQQKMEEYANTRAG